jgi:hypothetical protein
MIRNLWLAPALTAIALAQTNPGPKQEGGYWVDTVSGTLAARAKVRVTTLGAVHVQGESRGDVAYSLKRKVKARDEASARALLDRIVMKSVPEGEWTVLEVVAPNPRRASVDLHLRVPRDLREAAIESRGGAIQILDLNGAVQAVTAAGAVQADRIAGGMTVRTGGGTVRLGSIGGGVECFTGGGSIVADSLGGDSNLGTGGGEIVVHEARGLLRARTLGGNIRVEHAQRGVQVAASAGLINILQAGGPVMAETGAGSIRVQTANDVHCKTNAGTIQFQATSGGLHAITQTGSVLADLSGVKRIADSALATANGDITILIPSNLRVTVEAINSSSGSQRIVSDFAAIRPRLERGDIGWAARGALNGGGPLLRLTASGGTIYLRRRD